ncbi:MAG: hypothetical protein MUF03_10800 [Rubrivivax sp.]|nr:hypothetical protein [Rubrivivax sp.]
MVALPTAIPPRSRRRLALAGVAAALLAPVLLAALAIDRRPTVAAPTAVGTADVERALALLRRHDPRRLPPGFAGEAAIDARDLELLLNHGARRWAPGARARVHLGPGTMRVEASLPLPAGWANAEVRWTAADGLPRLEAARIGRLPVPDPVLRWATARALARAGLRADLDLAAEVVRAVEFAPGSATLRYEWAAGTPQRLLTSLLTAAEQERLHAYVERLAAASATVAPPYGEAALTRLLPELFALARERSAAGGAPEAENRAALAVLALHATGRRLSSVVPAARDWPRPRWLRVTLHGRVDLAQHLLVAAVLAAEGSSPLADAVGLYKELADARSGSGFGFDDLAADLAGARLGERAVRDAARLQADLAVPRSETELMPTVADLPAKLPAPVFRERFGGVGAPGYERIVAEIEQRIAATPLLR